MRVQEQRYSGILSLLRSQRIFGPRMNGRRKQCSIAKIGDIEALSHCFRLADSSVWHQIILEPRDSNLYGTLEMDGNMHDWGT